MNKQGRRTTAANVTATSSGIAVINLESIASLPIHGWLTGCGASVLPIDDIVVGGKAENAAASVGGTRKRSFTNKAVAPAGIGAVVGRSYRPNFYGLSPGVPIIERVPAIRARRHVV